MAGIGRYKLSDAMRDHQAQAELAQPQGAGEGGVPTRKGKGKGRGKGKSAGRPGESSASGGLAAEQLREARESKQAKNAEASTRDRMVDIGRGNQQAGRQKAK
jgi:hypothetical protein